jgi:hypothetical protein
MCLIYVLVGLFSADRSVLASVEINIRITLESVVGLLLKDLERVLIILVINEQIPPNSGFD